MNEGRTSALDKRAKKFLLQYAEKVEVADGEKAELLETSMGKALFYMNTLIRDQHGQPVHVGKQYIIGDRYQFIL